MSPEVFTEQVNSLFETWRAGKGGSVVGDGYAPFCKHLFVPNSP